MYCKWRWGCYFDPEYGSLQRTMRSRRHWRRCRCCCCCCHRQTSGKVCCNVAVPQRTYVSVLSCVFVVYVGVGVCVCRSVPACTSWYASLRDSFWIADAGLVMGCCAEGEQHVRPASCATQSCKGLQRVVQRTTAAVTALRVKRVKLPYDHNDVDRHKVPDIINVSVLKYYRISTATVKLTIKRR